MKEDIQGLMEVVKANENKKINMTFWAVKNHPQCGTIGCAIGNFCLENPQDKLVLRNIANTIQLSPSIEVWDGESIDILHSIDAVAYRFKISRTEAGWLFGFTHLKYFNKYHDDEWVDEFFIQRPDIYDSASVANRIRKFIYYKLHKNELIYDSFDRVKESARQLGHTNTVKVVKERLLSV